jgi:uncharacterized membrane protein
MQKKLEALLSFQSLGLLLVAAIVLRLPQLSSSFWLDEAAQVLESARPWYQQFDIIPDFQPPLLHLIVHFSLWFSRSEWWLRISGALIPALVGIVLARDLTTRWWGRWTGAWLGWLLATNSLLIFYSQELRPYALPFCWAVLSWWILDRWWGWSSEDKKTKIKSTSRNWQFGFSYALVTALGLYSSYLYPFLMLGQAAAIGLTAQKHVFKWLIAVGLGVALFVPWLPMFRLQLAAGGEVRQDLPGWSAVVSLPQLKALPLVFGKFIYGVLDLGTAPFFIVSGGLLVGLVGWSVWVTFRSLKKPWIVWLCWLLVPLLTSWVVSFWIPVVQPKRVLYLLPAFYAVLIALSQQHQTQKLKNLLPMLLLLINLWSSWSYFTQPKLQRENWRQLHQDVTTQFPANQSIAVFSFDQAFAPWRWYDNGEYPTLATGQLYIHQVPDLAQQLKPITQYKYVIVFDYLRDLSDPQNQLIAQVKAFGFKEAALLDYPNIGFVRVYAQPSALLTHQIRNSR